MNLQKYLLTLFITITIAAQASAQHLPDSTTKKIDALFKNWNNTVSPGYAIGIVRNDSLIYAKGYGMANLEYSIPITPETIFHMASVSKQFTAFSIVLLARQGKLSLDDDIRKYLPWFPDLKQKITIRHLLNHTSGVRDQWQLLAICGTRLDDVITQDQIIKILSKQQALNFTPGAEYSYSNSGFTMLAEIVRSVSGQSLRKFTDSAIFKPLGMTNTHFHDDYTEIVPNRSYSYERRGMAKFANATLSYSVAGPTSLFTNIGDMSKWVMNFYTHKVGDQNDIDQLTTKGRLNSGKDINYALGISVEEYNGHKMYAHNGADAGYRTGVSVFPDLKMGFIVFSNLNDADPSGKSNQLANLFIKKPAAGKSAYDVKPITDLTHAALEDTLMGKRIAGDYIADDGAHFVYAFRNKKLYWEPGGISYLLIKALKDTFVMPSQPFVKFVFATSKTGEAKVDQYWPGNHRLLVKAAPLKPGDDVLRTYTGRYYCPELDCSYTIILKDHKLVLTNAKYNDTPLTLYDNGQLTDEFWWMNNLQILRNEKHQVRGFEVNSGRIKHLFFKKVG